MALPDLSGSNIQATYQRVLHTDGTSITDGTGSEILSSNELTSLQAIGDSTPITSTEWIEIKNIGGAAISGTEWGYVAGMQDVGINSFPTFANLSIANLHPEQGWGAIQLPNNAGPLSPHLQTKREDASTPSIFLGDVGENIISFVAENGDVVSSIAQDGVYNGTVASATTAGTVTTAAQPAITSVGTLTSITSTGNSTLGNAITDTHTFDGHITASGNISAKHLHIKNTDTGNTGIVIENTNNDQNLDIDYWNNVGAVQGRIRYDEGDGAFSIFPNIGDTAAMEIDWAGNITASIINANEFRGQKIVLWSHAFGSTTKALFGNTTDNSEAGQLICGHASWGWTDRAWSQGFTKTEVESTGIDLTTQNNIGFPAPYKMTNIEFIGQGFSNQAASNFNITYYLYKHVRQAQATDDTQQLTPLWSQSLAHAGSSAFTDFYATGSTGLSCDAGDYLYVFFANGGPTSQGNARGSFTITGEIVETN